MRHKREVSTEGSNETLRVVISRALHIKSDAGEASAQMSAQIKLQHVVIIVALFAEHPGCV